MFGFFVCLCECDCVCVCGFFANVSRFLTLIGGVHELCVCVCAAANVARWPLCPILHITRTIGCFSSPFGFIPLCVSALCVQCLKQMNHSTYCNFNGFFNGTVWFFPLLVVGRSLSGKPRAYADCMRCPNRCVWWRINWCNNSNLRLYGTA